MQSTPRALDFIRKLADDEELKTITYTHEKYLRNRWKGLGYSVLLLLVFTRSLPRYGAWRETMEPQKLGNSPGSGPEVVQRQRVAKE